MSASEDRMLRHFLHTMAAGFILLLVLLLAVVGYTLIQLNQFAGDMERIVLEYNVKQQIATDMQIAAYRRSDALYDMALTDDPFDRDAYFMQFNQAGFDVGKARNAFRDMGMSEEESLLFDSQTRLIENVVVAQDEVVDLMSNDDIAGVRKVLQERVLPIQAELNETFQFMRDIEALGTTHVLNNTHASTRSTLLFALILGSLCILLGLTTALKVYRKVQQQSRQIARHVEEVEQARFEADKANRAKSDFLATMSHEIRTPMNGVLGMVQLMRTTPLNETQSDYLETIASSGEILLTLLNDVLDLSKIEAGHLELEKVDFQLERLVESVNMLMSGKAKLKGLKLSTEIAPGTPVVLSGDPNRVRQILFNLISNAVKFTKRGEVTIRISVLDNGRNRFHLRISVSDTGIGIEKDAIPTLFDAFSQADTSISRRFGGTGLGLAVCRKLVAAMDGSIAVTSTPGQGSEFYFDIPFAEGNPGSLITVAGERPNTHSGISHGPLHVLLAEDDSVNQSVAVNLLQHLGHSVEVVDNGERAVAAARDNRFDVILMDMQMPHLDGMEATRQIRELPDEQRASVPIIALTASVAPHMSQECLDAGMNHFLSKPVKQEALFDALSEIEPSQRRTRLSDRRSIDQIIAADIDQESVIKMCNSIGEDGVTELVHIFEDSSQQVLSELSQAWEQGDYPTMARKAHRLRGSSLSLGLRALAMLAKDTEKAAEDGRAASVRDLIMRLTTVRDQSMEELNKFLTTAG